MNYQHFSVEEREKVQEMLWQKASIRTIAKALNRSPSPISREVRRNKPSRYNAYTPRLTQARASEYRKHRGKRKLETDESLRKYVVTHLKLGWAPDIIPYRERLASINRIQTNDR